MLLSGCPASQSDVEPPDDTVVDSAHTGTLDTGVPPAASISGTPVVCDRDERATGLVYERDEQHGISSSLARLWGGGLAVFDVDNDDQLEILLVNDGGLTVFRWHSVPGEWRGEPVDVPVERAFGAAPADFDGDGDLDVYVTAYGTPDLLLRNDGTGVFEDVGAAMGLPILEAKTTAVTWGDVDGDRDLDLFLGGYGLVDELDIGPARPEGDPAFLYINNGNGFDDASHLLPDKIHDGYTLVAAMFDVNVDGFTDLYVVNDFGRRIVPNQVAFGPDWTLSTDAGLTAAIAGMGLGVGDLNADGVPDVAVSGWDATAVAVSSGAQWFDSALSLGVQADPDRDQRVGWGTQIADLDNDADDDIAMVFGYLQTVEDSNPSRQPDAVFLQRDDGTFADVARAWGVDDSGVQRGLVTADLNRDGWMDLVKADTRGGLQIYTSVCGDRRWVEVQLRAPAPNRFGVGARIQVTAGEATWWREVSGGGSGYASSGPPQVHVGLGEVEEIDELLIIWPDGQIDRFTDVASDHRLEVTRTARWR